MAAGPRRSRRPRISPRRLAEAMERKGIRLLHLQDRRRGDHQRDDDREIAGELDKRNSLVVEQIVHDFAEPFDFDQLRAICASPLSNTNNIPPWIMIEFSIHSLEYLGILFPHNLRAGS